MRKQAEILLRLGRYAEASALFRQEAEARRSTGDYDTAEAVEMKANRFSSGIWLYAYLPNARAVPRANRAKFEPVYGCYLGAFVDRDDRLGRGFSANGQKHQDPSPFFKLTGKKHASAFSYVGYGRTFPIAWVDRIKRQGCVPHIALEPNQGLDVVKRDDYLVDFARIAARSRVPIFLRYASEMNGSWTKYGGNPDEYKRKWKIVHDVMAEYAPNVVMLWCVNSTPEKTILSYYPGDDLVDWVGVNFYSVPFYNDDRNRVGWYDNPTDQMKFVYSTFEKAKPIAICEYGASRMSAVDKRDTTLWAGQKIIELFTALPRFYPRVKMVNIFDCNTMLYAEPGRQLNNYSVTDNEFIKRAYAAAIRSDYFLSDITPQKQPTVIAPMGPETRVARGNLRVSAWARCYSDPFTVVYSINGKEVHRQDKPGPREVTIGFPKQGVFTFIGTVVDNKGRIAARAQTRIIVT